MTLNDLTRLLFKCGFVVRVGLPVLEQQKHIQIQISGLVHLSGLCFNSQLCVHWLTCTWLRPLLCVFRPSCPSIVSFACCLPVWLDCRECCIWPGFPNKTVKRYPRLSVDLFRRWSWHRRSRPLFHWQQLSYFWGYYGNLLISRHCSKYSK